MEPAQTQISERLLCPRRSSTRLAAILRVLILFALLYVSPEARASGVGLTPEERAWLDAHNGKIRLAPCPDWEPMEIYKEDGIYTGIVGDIISLLEEKLDFKFKLVRADSWPQVEEMAKKGDLDVISAGVVNPERAAYMNWSSPYFHSPNTMICRTTLKGQLDVQRIIDSNLSVGVPQGYYTYGYYRKHYPRINIVETENLLEGLKKLAFGDIDVIIAEIPHVLYYINKYNISNLRLAGASDFKTSISVGTHKDLPVLTRIMDKGLAMISPDEIETIRKRWVTLSPIKFYQFRLFWYIVGILGLLVLVTATIMFWNKSLKKEVNKRTDQIKSSEQLFRDLVENSPTGLSIIQNGNVVYTNPEQKRLPEVLNFLETCAFDTVLPECKDKVVSFFDRINRADCEFQEIDFGYHTAAGTPVKDRTLKWVNCRACRIAYKGHPGILLNVIDRSRSKRMERLLMVQEKMASLGHICAGIAHEIRNPLAGINIHMRNLEKMYRGDAHSLKKIQTCFRLMHSDSGRIESVVRRTLDFAKPTQPSFSQVNINGVIMKTIKLTQVTLRHRQIHVRQHLCPANPVCFAEAQLIGDVIYNLVINASDAMTPMKENKIIRVSSHTGRRDIILLIDDTGPGVEKELRKKIFDPFYTTKTDSTGIGLSICRRVVLDHKGQLYVKSNPWKGARFVVKLPIRHRS